ncbi:hypothetical protein HanPSC8_Chr02g0078091 [Helianthus annuus]|nr:hypothetical protein HanPSC8_Chr02g0078091 [Helianthus annuus]
MGQTYKFDTDRNGSERPDSKHFLPESFFFFHRKCVKYGYQILHCFVIIQIISLFFFFFFFAYDDLRCFMHKSWGKSPICNQVS